MGIEFSIANRTQQQILSLQVADDLARATSIVQDVNERIANASDQALEALLDGLNGRSAERGAAGRAALASVSNAAQKVSLIEGLAGNLRLALRKTAPITPAVAAGLGDHMRQIGELRDDIERILERSDRKLAAVAAPPRYGDVDGPGWNNSDDTWGGK